MNRIKTGLSDVWIVQLSDGDDLLERIKEVVREEQIDTGVVLSITGTLRRASFQRFENAKKSIGITSIEKPLEISGSGIVGRVVAPHQGDQPFSFSQYRHGDCFVHVHLTMTSANETVCGHMMPGCLVRAEYKISHFTLVLGRLLGGRLELDVNAEAERQATGRGVYYRMTQDYA